MHYIPVSLGGFQQVVGAPAAIPLTIPKGANGVLIQVEGQNVRWRWDGTPPTATTGELMKAGAKPQYFSERLSKIQLIEVAPSATINLTFCY